MQRLFENGRFTRESKTLKEKEGMSIEWRKRAAEFAIFAKAEKSQYGALAMRRLLPTIPQRG